MTTRREKSKPQKPQLNKQLEAVNAEEPKVKDSGTWKENLGKYLIDISKYVVTGVIIASTFKELDDKFTQLSEVDNNLRFSNLRFTIYVQFGQFNYLSSPML